MDIYITIMLDVIADVQLQVIRLSAQLTVHLRDFFSLIGNPFLKKTNDETKGDE